MSRCLAALACVLSFGANAAPAADSRPNAWGYRYPHSLDAEIAAPEVHHVRYADDHVMLMEVANPSGYRMQMHGHPYPSIFARDTAAPNPGQGALSGETFLDPASPRNGQNWRMGAAPAGTSYPTCAAADPEDPHAPANNSGAPIHFYRIEFRKLDATAGPAAAKAYAALPERRILYRTDALRLVEVTLQPGHAETTANRLPAVVATDMPAAFDAVLAAAGPGAGRSDPPVGMAAPRCVTTAAGRGAPVRNTGTAPLHFYRIEYMRIDGDALKDHWREWYPYMATMH